MNKAIFIAGPMQGYRNFNFAAFDKAAADLTASGWLVFSPADRDRERYGDGVWDSATGNPKDVPQFNLREALGADTAWLCAKATAIYMLRGWELSKGAQAEWALARALGLDIFYQ